MLIEQITLSLSNPYLSNRFNSAILFTVFCLSGFFDPVGQVSHKVKEEVPIWNTDDLGKPHGQPFTNHIT